MATGSSSGGERDLATLLAALDPALEPGRYVFALAADGVVPAGVQPVATVSEDEGLTVVALREQADRAGLPYTCVMAKITLRVHSSLEAVGLTAAIAVALADEGISANVIAGAHHDHVFLPEADTRRALKALTALASHG